MNVCHWDGPLLMLDYITSGLGRDNLSSKLTNLFSWHFEDLCWVLPQSNPFPRPSRVSFPHLIWCSSQAGDVPFMVIILASTANVPAEEFSLSCLFSLRSPGKWTHCTLGRLESWSFLPTQGRGVVLIPLARKCCDPLWCLKLPLQT